MANSSILGFYFAILQSQLNGYVKCWLDGSDSWDYYSTNEVIELANKTNDPSKVLLQLQDVLTQTSFFLWDVDNDSITRLRMNQTEESIANALKEGRLQSNQSPNSFKFGNTITFDSKNIDLNIEK